MKVVYTFKCSPPFEKPLKICLNSWKVKQSKLWLPVIIWTNLRKTCLKLIAGEQNGVELLKKFVLIYSLAILKKNTPVYSYYIKYAKTGNLVKIWKFLNFQI